MIGENLDKILNQQVQRIKQNEEEATYAFTIKREDEKIDFSKTKREIYNQIRGLNSWPGAYCLYENKILKVWQSYVTENYSPELFDGQITKIYPDGIGIKVSNGEIVLTEVQPEGKKKMSAIEFVNGEKNKGNLVGKILN